jgi:hypothetical protein
LASEPPVNEAFLREVDDELRRDQIEGFWRRFGRPLLGGAGALLAAWAGWLWWDGHQKTAQGLDGETMSAAVTAVEGNDFEGARAKLKGLKSSSYEGYRTSARLTEAGLAAQNGNVPSAIKTYREVAADTSVAAPWRDLALIRQTAAEFDLMKPEAVIARLKPLAVPGNPWFGSAGEMSAMAWLKAGKPELAAKLFADLGKDEKVPETIRSRAIQMAGVLGASATPPAKDVSQ